MVTCCAAKCNNRFNKQIDLRTGKFFRFHRFSNAIKRKDVCQKWLQNIRRCDLTLQDLEHMRVCSEHFEPAAYKCPTDLENSRLLENAYPTLFNVSNPPPRLTPKRPPPKTRPPPPPPKRRKSSTAAICHFRFAK
ncbi:hypothetical protein CAPTEDRAFT_214598 [Capitella teleta]|uniref:THAP-type domain-containing protein n=1 Tax=Capitella teleta TaxID=283909 RepID=R7T5G2_CAPTE|nr:hypothetical protein CAPTEDRAFT_214598 [Capitella teleta]|eukprot:ELT88256.1 hypothetical protein CAPTEDRAFT_214598 [Capitella teleta]